MPTTQIRGNTQIIAATITNAEISGSAAIALSKLAEAVIQADGGQAFTADQSVGNFKLTNLGTPTAAGDAANKSYVDSVSAGLDPKGSVRVATTVAGTLSTSFENGDVIDGVTLVTGDRILIKDQASGEFNGIYTVNSSGTPTRATDADISAEVTGGMFAFVEEGTVNGDTGWVLTTNNAIVLNTTALVFTQFTGAGVILGGAGLTKTGNTIDVIGTANRIVVAADTVDIGTDVVTLTGTQTLSNKTLSSPVVNTPTGIVKGDVGLGNVDNTSNATERAATATLTNKTLTSPVINTPTGIVKGDVGLGNVDNTSNATERAATATLTNKTIALGSNTVTGTMAQFDTAVTDSNFVFMASVITRETPTGLVNSSNTAYTLANTPVAGSEEVYLNGIMQEPGGGNDYTISGTAITYLTAPVTGDKIRVSYLK